MNNLLIIFVALLFSAFFSGMEIAFIASNRLLIELDKKQGVFSSPIIGVFVKNPAKFLTTMLVGNNVAMVVYGSAMALILEPFLSRFISSSGLVLLTQTILSTLLILMTGEFLPKTVFRGIPNLTLNIFSLPGYFFYLLFYPLTSLLVWIANAIIEGISRKRVREENRPGDVFNKIDLVNLINLANANKETEETEENDLKIFHNALYFSSVKVRDCMVPRTEIIAIEVNSPLEELQQKFITSGYSKILIYEDNPDNMIGYITSKTIFKTINSIRENIIDVSFIPEAMSAKRMLEKFIQEKKSIAVVVDEFGGVSGILTTEDIMEEIFGEIEDEHDIIDLVEKQVSEDEYIFSGRLEIDYLNEKYKLNIPESEDYDTITGLIFQNYENIPIVNESIKIGNFTFRIMKVSKTKIDLVNLKINRE